jgi:hypothetical protein
VVDVASGKPVFEHLTPGDSVLKVALSPDGAHVAAARQGVVSRFEVATGAEISRAKVTGCVAAEQVFPAAWCDGR